MWTWLRRLWPLHAAPAGLGDRGERLAAAYLQRQGLRILERNARSRLGELDLVAADGDQVVFVEVKTRQAAAHGQPVEAVTPEKQRRLTQAALGYLKRRGWLERRTRFDVVAVLWPDDQRPPEIVHYRHAFEAVGRGQMYS